MTSRKEHATGGRAGSGFSRWYFLGPFVDACCELVNPANKQVQRHISAYGSKTDGGHESLW